MRVIDAHVHTLDNYQPMAPFEDMGRVDRLLHWMDDAGVDKAVMLPVVADFSPENNEECANWARNHPERLAAMTDVPLHEANAAERVRAAREQYGAVAISCYPSTPDLAWLTEPDAEPLWDAFKESGLPCNLHVTQPNYSHIITAARQHPEVPILLNHFALPKGGGVTSDDPSYGGLASAADVPNLFVKVSAFYAAADTPWDPACPVPLAYLQRLLGIFGAARLLFGTDWPPAGKHLSYRQGVEIVRTYAELSPQDRDLILSGTAARLFGI
jgi:L-fuconolactonase|tara:strand:+ start:367 stop:1179 length:813 start_codon:yes stop_codon:yes gene_type:complete